MNTNKYPTNDMNARKAIIHVVNKGRLIEEEFGGLKQPVGQLLPQSAPFSNCELYPVWSYDPYKAELLNCPKTVVETEIIQNTTIVENTNSELSDGAIAGIAVGALFILLL